MSQVWMRGNVSGLLCRNRQCCSDSISTLRACGGLASSPRISDFLFGKTASQSRCVACWACREALSLLVVAPIPLSPHATTASFPAFDLY
jgi:hypothetical protein